MELTGQDWLDAVEDDGDRQQGAELRYGTGHRLAPGEDVADIVAGAHDDDRDDDGYDERHRVHHQHRERGGPRVPGPQLVAHTHAVNTRFSSRLLQTSSNNLFFFLLFNIS